MNTEHIRRILDYYLHNGINMWSEFPSVHHRVKTLHTSFVFYTSRPSAFARRKFDLGNSVPVTAICQSCTLIYLPPIYDPWSCSIMPILGSFCLPVFFSSLASTIHPRALIEARTAGAEYREKKSRRSRPSSGDLCTRCMIDTRWRCPDVARLVGRSVVQKARTREKRCDTRRDGRTDGQTGGQKVKCPRRRIKWRFRIRSLPSVRLSGKWKGWKGAILASASAGEPACK